MILLFYEVHVLNQSNGMMPVLRPLVVKHELFNKKFHNG